MLEGRILNTDTQTPISIVNTGNILNGINGIMNLENKRISGDGNIVLKNNNVDESFKVKSHPKTHFKFETLNSYLIYMGYSGNFNIEDTTTTKIFKLKKETLLFGKYKKNHKTTVVITRSEVLNLQNNNLIVGINIINEGSIILPVKSFLSFYSSKIDNHKLNLKNNGGTLRYYYNPNYNNSTQTLYYSYGFSNDKFEKIRKINNNID